MKRRVKQVNGIWQQVREKLNGFKSNKIVKTFDHRPSREQIREDGWSGSWEEMFTIRPDLERESNLPDSLEPHQNSSQTNQETEPMGKKHIKEPKPIKRTKNWELYPSDFDETLMIAGDRASDVKRKTNKTINRFQTKKQHLAKISPILSKQWISLPEKNQGKKKIRPKKSPW